MQPGAGRRDQPPVVGEPFRLGAVKLPKLPPVLGEAAQQGRVGARQPRIVRRIGQEVRNQILHESAALAGRHHRRRAVALQAKRHLGIRRERHEPLGFRRCLGASLLRLPHHRPEARRAAGVDHQMDARFGACVHHLVAAPGIEQPALAGGHVQRFGTAVEGHRRIRRHRNVDAHAAEPVVVEVHVQAHLAARIQLHQARPRQHFAEARHRLTHVGTLRQVRRRLLLAVEGIVVAAAAGDQRHCRVADHAARMRHPAFARQCAAFRSQPRRVEAERQADEGLAQTHGE